MEDLQFIIDVIDYALASDKKCSLGLGTRMFPGELLWRDGSVLAILRDPNGESPRRYLVNIRAIAFIVEPGSFPLYLHLGS